MTRCCASPSSPAPRRLAAAAVAHRGAGVRQGRPRGRSIRRPLRLARSSSSSLLAASAVGCSGWATEAARIGRAFYAVRRRPAPARAAARVRAAAARGAFWRRHFDAMLVTAGARRARREGAGARATTLDEQRLFVQCGAELNASLRAPCPPPAAASPRVATRREARRGGLLCARAGQRRLHEPVCASRPRSGSPPNDARMTWRVPDGVAGQRSRGAPTCRASARARRDRGGAARSAWHSLRRWTLKRSRGWRRAKLRRARPPIAAAGDGEQRRALPRGRSSCRRARADALAPARTRWRSHRALAARGGGRGIVERAEFCRARSRASKPSVVRFAPARCRRAAATPGRRRAAGAAAALSGRRGRRAVGELRRRRAASSALAK